MGMGGHACSNLSASMASWPLFKISAASMCIFSRFPNPQLYRSPHAPKSSREGNQNVSDTLDSHGCGLALLLPSRQ